MAVITLLKFLPRIQCIKRHLIDKIIILDWGSKQSVLLPVFVPDRLDSEEDEIEFDSSRPLNDSIRECLKEVISKNGKVRKAKRLAYLVSLTWHIFHLFVRFEQMHKVTTQKQKWQLANIILQFNPLRLQTSAECGIQMVFHCIGSVSIKWQNVCKKYNFVRGLFLSIIFSQAADASCEWLALFWNVKFFRARSSNYGSERKTWIHQTLPASDYERLCYGNGLDIRHCINLVDNI